MSKPAFLPSMIPDPVVALKEEYLVWDSPLSAEDRSAVARFENPAEWAPSRKAFVCGVSILTTFMAAYSISAYVSGATAMANEFHSTKEVVLVGMTTFQTGFAVGPMVLAPLSEINGRKPVFLATYMLFNSWLTLWAIHLRALTIAVGTLTVALINNLPGLLVVRFFQGIGASTFSSMVGTALWKMPAANASRSEALSLTCMNPLLGDYQCLSSLLLHFPLD
jgi:MFS family permease